jgi:hypothetical protein
MKESKVSQNCVLRPRLFKTPHGWKGLHHAKVKAVRQEKGFAAAVAEARRLAKA